MFSCVDVFRALGAHDGFDLDPAAPHQERVAVPVICPLDG
jgi:hypothetical protein